MSQKRREKQYDGRFTTQVAIEAIKNQQTIAQITSEYGDRLNQVSQWKKQVLEGLPDSLQTDAHKRLLAMTT